MTLLKNKGIVNDRISDMLTRIRNANSAQKSSVMIPKTKMTLEIAQILEKEGFIENLQQSLESDCLLLFLKYRSKKVAKLRTKESCITNLKRLSKPGLRVYVNHRQIPRVLAGTGTVILSTPNGLMTDREARSRGIGGELLFSIW